MMRELLREESGKNSQHREKDRSSATVTTLEAVSLKDVKLARRSDSPRGARKNWLLIGYRLQTDNCSVFVTRKKVLNHGSILVCVVIRKCQLLSRCHVRRRSSRRILA